MATESLLVKLNAGKSTYWPQGLACEVIVVLKATYQPTDRISRVELRRKLNNVSMKKTGDPKDIFEQLSGIKDAFESGG